MTADRNRDTKSLLEPKILARFGIGEAYQNFLDPSLNNFLWQYYGSNLNQLRMIKGQVDPSNVFHFPQSIPPSSGF